MSYRPKSPVIGENIELQDIIYIALETLRINCLHKESIEMISRIDRSQNVFQTLGIVGDYIDPVPEEIKEMEEYE